MSKATNWANAGKAATAAVPLAKNGNKKDRGIRRVGQLHAASLKSYKTGSFGVEFQYTIEGMDTQYGPRKVYENVVLSVMNKDGILNPTQYGAATLKRRLQAFGLTADEVNQIGTPVTVKSEFNLSPIIGTGVAIYTRDAEYMGKPKLEVASVFPLDGEQQSA